MRTGVSLRMFARVEVSKCAFKMLCSYVFAHVYTPMCLHRLPRQVLNVAWAMHELVGDHADEALAWLEERHEHAAGNRPGWANDRPPSDVRAS